MNNSNPNTDNDSGIERGARTLGILLAYYNKRHDTLTLQPRGLTGIDVAHQWISVDADHAIDIQEAR